MGNCEIAFCSSYALSTCSGERIYVEAANTYRKFSFLLHGPGERGTYSESGTTIQREKMGNPAVRGDSKGYYRRTNVESAILAWTPFACYSHMPFE